MGFFSRGSPHEEPTEMPPTGDCPYKHRGPRPHWSSSPRHHCPESVNHGPAEQAFENTESKCPLSRRRKHFMDRAFQNREELWLQHGFGPHDRPPFFGHHHRHHHGPPRDFDPRAVYFHGCPLSRWRNHEYKPVFDRRFWE